MASANVDPYSMEDGKHLHISISHANILNRFAFGTKLLEIIDGNCVDILLFLRNLNPWYQIILIDKKKDNLFQGIISILAKILRFSGTFLDIEKY